MIFTSNSLLNRWGTPATTNSSVTNSRAVKRRASHRAYTSLDNLSISSQLINTASSETLSFVYEVSSGLGERLSSHKSVDALQDINYFASSTAAGLGDALKENMYIAEKVFIKEVTHNNKKYIIVNKEIFTYESDDPDITTVYDIKIGSGGGVQVKDGVHGSIENIITIVGNSKSKTYNSIYRIANSYILYPSISNNETFTAYSSDGSAYTLTNMGDGNRTLTIDF
jgi:hypothetical protein